MASSIVIASDDFQANCLALLDSLAERGGELIVTKKGKPMARVLPLSLEDAPSLKGSVIYQGDLISPVDDPWEVGS